MILNVNPKWRIVSDTEQWIVQRSGKHKGETVWKGVRWFDTPSAATWWLVGRQVREIPGEYPCADALTVLGTHLERIGDDIKAAIEARSKGEG